jgi:hypothetical protein
MGPEPTYGTDVAGLDVPGWMSDIELRWLRATAETMGSVAEIGCLHGRSSTALLTGCKGPVWCIDTWDDEHDVSFGSFMGHCGRFANLHAVRGLSPAVAVDVPDVDMCFIDGAHTYEAVLADIAGWLPKTRRLLCGHDYYPGEGAGFPGVAEAVNAVFGIERLHVPGGTSIWTVDLTEDRTVLPLAPSGEMSYRDEYDRDVICTVAWPVTPA